MDDSSPWYKTAFRSDYLERYAHRDEAEAFEFVRSLVQPWFAAGESVPVLDLCCGASRHSVAMARIGAHVVGYDLSDDLLRAGRGRIESAAGCIHLVRGDMRRLPFRNGSFAMVVNAFTAFGYFESDEENRTVIEEVARVLAPRGLFILDFANRAVIIDRLGTGGRSVTVVGSDGRTALEVRRMTSDLRRVERVRFEPSGPDRVPTVLESVRLYSPAELVELLSGCGLVTERMIGDYRGNEFLEATADRVVILARRAEKGELGT